MTRKIRDERGYLVVKDNDLIQKARYNLTAQEQKIIMYAISKTKPDDKDFTWLELSVSEFCELTGTNITKAYHEFKTMIDKLDQKSCWVKLPEKTFKFRWFIMAEYLNGQGKLRAMLHPDLKQYIIGLKANFTQYELWNVLALKGKYSLRLFEWFKSYSYQQIKEIKVDDLKELLMIGEEKYKTFKDFDRRVLKKAVDEINSNTELIVEYEKVKRGKSIYKLIFHISVKDTGALADMFIEKKERERAELEKDQIDGQMYIDEFLED